MLWCLTLRHSTRSNDFVCISIRSAHRRFQVKNFSPDTEFYVCRVTFNGGQSCKNFVCRRREHDKVSSNIFRKFQIGLPCPTTRCCFTFFLSSSTPNFIHSHFPYIIFLPHWIKTVAIIYRHFPHSKLLHIIASLHQWREKGEHCRRETRTARWLLADMAAREREQHFHFGAFSLWLDRNQGENRHRQYFEDLLVRKYTCLYYSLTAVRGGHPLTANRRSSFSLWDFSVFGWKFNWLWTMAINKICMFFGQFFVHPWLVRRDAWKR